ncbi:hypothetical protein [Intestinibacter sp.]|uniref:hypothetical protein n=1 Tax=Intestinibacter sp. TaxID=1965304 RepID=UPI003F17683D
MKTYESIIKQMEEQLNEIEYDIENNSKDKELIEEDLFYITNKAINAKDSFKLNYFKHKDPELLKEIKEDYAYKMLDKLSDCIARCAYLKCIIFMH